MGIKVEVVTPPKRVLFVDGIKALETGVSYPLGEDRFEIDHGEDYFAFFDRLGELTYTIAVDDGAVVAVAGAMLRQIPPSEGSPGERVWYASDLKVRPSHRGRRLGWKMLMRVFARSYVSCSRGYAVAMNSGGGERTPRSVRMARAFRLIPVRTVGLELFSLDAPTMRDVAPVIGEELGPLSYLSLAGVKDIVLESTGQPMPLLHVQHGPCAAPGHEAPVEDHVHMFCLPSDDVLIPKLMAMGLKPSASATVVYHRMKHFDWRFVLTSDI